MDDSLLQTVQGELKYGEDFADLADGASIGPLFGKDRVKPDGMGKGFGNKPLVCDLNAFPIRAKV